MRVLIIEDDTDITANLYDYLEDKNCSVDSAADGVSGLHLAVTNDYDVILLDLTLPGLDGLMVCQKLRQEAKRDTPILMLTARDHLDDKLEGFKAGADDYLIKPFALSEVEARIKALDKRHKGQVAERELQAAGIVFNLETFEVMRNGNSIKLPKKCLNLLKVLMSSPNRVCSHTELEMEVWDDVPENSDTLRSHMHTLRQALTTKGEWDPIKTVHGIGYRLIPDNAKRI